jgi:hypothetical protein
MFPPIDCAKNGDDCDESCADFRFPAANLNITERRMIPVQPMKKGGNLHRVFPDSRLPNA